MHQPHVPRTPNPRFVGSTDMGPRGDVIAEADWCIGELIKTLEKEQLLENTLIIFTSDNGPVVNDGYEDQSVERLGNQKPGGPLRGGKYSLDRKSVVEGKSGAARVDLGGGRIIKKK